MFYWIGIGMAVVCFAFMAYVMFDYLQGKCSEHMAWVYSTLFAAHGCLGLFIAFVMEKG